MKLPDPCTHPGGKNAHPDAATMLTAADPAALESVNEATLTAYRHTIAFRNRCQIRAALPPPKRRTLLVSTDASRVEGADRGITHSLAKQREERPCCSTCYDPREAQ